MGFSVSGSAAIIFIGLIVAAGIAIPSIVGSFGSLAGAQGQQVDRGIDSLNTEFDVWTATYDNGSDDGSDELELRLNNTGSTSLSVNGTTVLVDGVVPSDENVSTTAEGDPGASLWLPGETLTITIGGETEAPERVKIVTENGIAETEEEFEDP